MSGFEIQPYRPVSELPDNFFPHDHPGLGVVVLPVAFPQPPLPNRVKEAFNELKGRVSLIGGLAAIGLITIPIFSTSGDLNQTGMIVASVGLAVFSALGCVWISASYRRLREAVAQH